MTVSSIDGITLCSFPLKANSKIVKVYTNKRGLLSFVLNNISAKNTNLIAFSSPCTLSEIVYIDKNVELLKIKEVTIKNQYLFIRDSLEKIRSAIGMMKSMLSSQIQDKSNEVLFYTLTKYLHKLSESNNPYSYLCSFQLKLLLIDGWIHLSDKCSICNKNANYIAKGDYFCSNHINQDGIPFNKDELIYLHQLARAKKFSEIDLLKIEISLRQKIEKLFLHILN